MTIRAIAPPPAYDTGLHVEVWFPLHVRRVEMTRQNFLKGSTRAIALSSFFSPMPRLAAEDWTQLQLLNLGITSFSYAHVFF